LIAFTYMTCTTVGRASQQQNERFVLYLHVIKK